MNQFSVYQTMFFQVLKRAKYGTIELLSPEGEVRLFGEGEPLIRVELKNWNVVDLLFKKGDLGLAEAIISGNLVIDNHVHFVEWACRNEEVLGNALHGTWYGNLFAMLRRFLHRNHRKQAQKNIMAHYDLGNEFYKLWLDPSMSYSSALFTKSDQSIYEAQLAKYDRIIDRLNIKSSDHVLEIGCGWGGFFTRAVERTGCQVTAVMNSPQQARYNEQRIASQNMGQQVHLRQQDYRDIEGKFDKVVSIEMIEAVGQEYWGSFFNKVNASLKVKGEALIQSITIKEEFFESYSKGTDFIQQHIFPGGMLLTNQVFQEFGQKNSLQLSEVFQFGQNYADTLKIWRDTFNSARRHVDQMGFDEQFVRLWNFYLSYCEGAFRAGRINVGQYLFERKS
jgi:cyclopropane-fatty-acyl-phospholipid synthase